MGKTTIYHSYVPRSPLSQFVKFFWSSKGDNLPSSWVNLLPIGSMELVINLNSDTIPLFEQLRCAGGERTNHQQCGSTSNIRICGIHSQSFIIDKHSQISVMGVRFQAGGGVPFFQFPARELHNQVISVDELWNFHAEELWENLLKASTIKTRFLVLENFLLSMMQPRAQHPIVDFGLREFERTPTNCKQYSWGFFR